MLRKNGKYDLVEVYIHDITNFSRKIKDVDSLQRIFYFIKSVYQEQEGEIIPLFFYSLNTNVSKKSHISFLFFAG